MVRVEVSVSGAGAVKTVSPDGRTVTIDTSGIRKGASFQITYPVRPLRPPGTLAEVALILDAGLLTPAAAPRGFIIPFAASASFWAYYVVMDFGGDISPFVSSRVVARIKAAIARGGEAAKPADDGLGTTRPPAANRTPTPARAASPAP